MFAKRRTLLVLGVTLALLAAGCDWVTFGYGPARTGHNPLETTIGVDNVASLHERWSAVAGLDVWSSPVVVADVAYVGGTDNKLYAFDANGVRGCSGPTPKTCTPLWTALTGGYVGSTPSVSDGVVYVGSEDGHLYAFDAKGVTGCSGSPKQCTPLWRANTSGYGYPGTSPAVVDGTVYVGTNDHKLYAFDAAGQVGCSGSPKTCAPLWTATTTDPFYTLVSTPAVEKGVVYATNGATLYAFDAKGLTGCSGTPKICTPLWRATGPSERVGGLLKAPAVAGDVVYAGSNEREFAGQGKLYAFDAKGLTGCSGSPKTCLPLWSVPIGPFAADGSPAVANGLIYIGSREPADPVSGGPFGTLQAFDRTGAKVWSSTEIRGTVTSPAVANGLVYTGSGDDKLYAFDAAGTTGCSGTPTTCAPLWSAPKRGPSSPAVAHGVVYFGSLDGRLHAYGPP